MDLGELMLVLTYNSIIDYIEQNRRGNTSLGNTSVTGCSLAAIVATLFWAKG